MSTIFGRLLYLVESLKFSYFTSRGGTVHITDGNTFSEEPLRYFLYSPLVNSFHHKYIRFL